MFDKFIIGSAADSLKISDPLSAYSRVTLKVADGVEYTACLLYTSDAADD